jgi:hypothetical protein
MNRAGRLSFVKAVLNAIPLHQLIIHASPKKTLKLLTRIEPASFGPHTTRPTVATTT